MNTDSVIPLSAKVAMTFSNVISSSICISAAYKKSESINIVIGKAYLIHYLVNIQSFAKLSQCDERMK